MFYYKVPVSDGKAECTAGSILLCAYPQDNYMVCKFESVAKVGSGWVKITAEEFEANCPDFPIVPDDAGILTNIDFSNFGSGSFEETVDGKVTTHSVTFDEKGRPASIDEVDIEWGDIDPGPVESTEYPGCYYRDADGENEWINPPMVFGEVYRTSERYNGKAVYKACIHKDNVTGTSGTTSSYQHSLMLAAYPHVIGLSGVVSSTYDEMYEASKYGYLKAEYAEGELSVSYLVTEVLAESSVDIIVKFTLD